MGEMMCWEEMSRGKLSNQLLPSVDAGHRRSYLNAMELYYTQVQFKKQLGIIYRKCMGLEITQKNLIPPGSLTTW